MANTITPEQQFYSNFAKNLKIIEAAKKKINSEINDSLRKNDDHSVKVYTKIYLLIYTSWTEAYLVKLVHTPHGFSLTEKENILRSRDVLVRWKTCINTAFQKISALDPEIHQKTQKINDLLDRYLKTQANIRNKIAHGQWEYPLFSNNLTHDPDITIYLNLIDVIQIDIWFDIFKEVAEIVLGLIDSRPHNNHSAHYNNYLVRLENIQNIITEKRSRTLEDKRTRLKLKPRK